MRSLNASSRPIADRLETRGIIGEYARLDRIATAARRLAAETCAECGQTGHTWPDCPVSRRYARTGKGR